MPTLSPLSYLYALRRFVLTRPRHAAAFALSLLVPLAAAGSYWQQKKQAAALAHAAIELKQAIDRAPAASKVVSDTAKPALPAFVSAEFVAALDQLSESSKLPMDEVSYSLDDNANLPYLRYRATMTVEGDYAAIRQLVAHISGAQGSLSLDTLHCSREDIDVKPLSCELGISGFYARGGHG